MKNSVENGGSKNLAVNRKARQLYSVEETLESGIELKGTEVKSMRAAQFSFGDAYAKIDGGELWLVKFHISPYDFGNRHNHDPDRDRRLLVHKQEIKKLRRKVEEKGLTLIPLRFYLKKGLVKLELGVCRGKRLYDRRQDIKKRDLKRDAEREVRYSIH
jgi:SsrA-binding protein